MKFAVIALISTVKAALPATGFVTDKDGTTAHEFCACPAALNCAACVGANGDATTAGVGTGCLSCAADMTAGTADATTGVMTCTAAAGAGKAAAGAGCNPTTENTGCIEGHKCGTYTAVTAVAAVAAVAADPNASPPVAAVEAVAEVKGVEAGDRCTLEADCANDGVTCGAMQLGAS